MQKGTVLSIDDDRNLQAVLNEYLRGNGFNIIQATDAESALQKAEGALFDVILLDLALPDGEGTELLSRFKNSTNSAIIVISGRSETTDKIICLEMGADDYLTKPFEMRELSARIKAVMRRVEPGNDTEAAYKNAADIVEFSNGWRLDRRQFQLFDSDGQSREITAGQFRLLEALLNAPNRVLSREYLFELTHNSEFEVYDRAVDIQITRLRKKLDDTDKSKQLIKTVRGVGYMFCDDRKASLTP